ncbi:MAG: low temperature requirement protein A [Thermomicrobiales bacterium]
MSSSSSRSAQAASSLHHAVAEDHIGDGIVSYLMVFFAIWWAWVNFTWFSSAYDNNDVIYRLLVFAQLFGALVLAAGVTTAFEENSWGIPIVGYVIMRLPLAIQWLRAAVTDEQRRPTAIRYAAGVILVQIAWCGVYFIPDSAIIPVFLALVVCELAVPAWAERAARTTWHAGHIAERYGLLTIIVLGESILAATLAIEDTTITTTFDGDLTAIIAGAFLTVLSMWWLYFSRISEELLTTFERTFVWGYGHYFIFSSAAAVGAGIAISVDYATDHAAIGSFAAGASVAIPAAVFLMGIWSLHFRFLSNNRYELFLAPAFAIAILLTPLTGFAVLLTGVLLATLVALEVAIQQRAIAPRSA